MYFPHDCGRKIAKCQRYKAWNMEQFGFFASLGKTNKYLPLRLILCQADRIDERSLLEIPVSSSNKTLFGRKLTFHKIE